MNHTDRKAEIIDASITLFCEKGLDLTSMQDIAAATLRLQQASQKQLFISTLIPKPP